MSNLKLNILANFVGQGWTALLQLVFVPVYIKFLGVEAYGLIGFYVMLLTALRLLDFGLGQTVSREMAKYSVMPGKEEEVRDFTRTVELVYWGVGTVVGLAVVAAAPLIAEKWIKAEGLSPAAVKEAVTLMGVVIALQWPLGFYQGGLLGLQKQVVLNMLRMLLVTFGSGGGALILWLVSPTVFAFFSWQVFTSIVSIAVCSIVLWRSLPDSSAAPRFSFDLIRNIWRFAAGMSGITVAALLLTQLDKWILINLLSLESFGYYILATTVANGLYMFITPVFSAIFPKFSAMVASHDETNLRRIYHGGTQLMAIVILPTAAVLSLFSREILAIWTGNAAIAEEAAPIVSALVIGTAINGLMNIPYALQLAHGWTGLALRIMAILIVMLIPTIFYMTIAFGPVGAAMAWIILNLLYMAIAAPLTMRRCLAGEGHKWLTDDILVPLLMTMAVVGIGKVTMGFLDVSGLNLAGIVLILLLAVAASALAAGHIRAWLLLKLSQWRGSNA